MVLLLGLVPWLCWHAAEAGDVPPEGVVVHLAQGMRGSILEPRFSAPATETPLVRIDRGTLQGRNPLEGHLRIGRPSGASRRVVLLRSRADKPYDLLLIDGNGDGSLDGDRPVQAEKRERDGSIWSLFEVTVRVDHGAAGKPSWQEFAISLWVAVESEAEEPALLYHVARGYLAGDVSLEGTPCTVVLSDGNNDGVYEADDWWTLRVVGQKGPYDYVAARKVGDFAWVQGRAWKFALRDTTGREGRILPFKPGITQEADDKKRDPYWADRRAPRAKSPLTFAVDFDAALADARKRQAPVLLFFVTRPCPTCDQMKALVYSAAAVVEAAKGLVGIQVDTAKRKSLAEHFHVETYPTGILMGPEGDELARVSGYLGVGAFQQFLAEANPYLRPSDAEPKLRGKAKARHKKEVKRHFDYLQDSKIHGLLTDRIRELGSQKTRAVRDALIRFVIKRKSKEYIAAAFDALAKIAGKKAIAFLCGKKALGSGDFLVAQSAAQSLAIAKDPAATTTILEVMTHKGTKIEIVAACALALSKSAPEDERVVKAIFEYSEHRKDTIRAAAAEALGHLKSTEAVERLKVLLTSDKNTRVRAAAATGIGFTGRTDLIPLLRRVIEADKAHTVRTEALTAIRLLQDDAQAK